MTPEHVERMRAANRRFAAALDTGDVLAALAADDDVHEVYLDATGNHTLRSTVERLSPRIRRLERLRFASLPGRDSVAVHEAIADACAAGDADRAADLVYANWDSLSRLIETTFAEDAAPAGG